VVGIHDAGRVDDVGAIETWDRLRNDPTSILIDVRTRAEWAFVGLPDLTQIGKQPVLVEWQTFPDNREDPRFEDRLTAELRNIAADKGTQLFFICRSGSRSRRAAQTMSAAGFTHCHNVADGFEGPLDSDHHRGRTGGWKAANLPWGQG
jgi:rhodanese-related sulfurtransferase